MNFFDVLIVQPIFNLLVLIYNIVPLGDVGITIVLFTLLVRFLMYPLLRRQLHQTRIMQKLQPELKKIKKNAGGNKQVEALQMMELYKEHGVSPFRSIGLLLIQLPIFFGLYFAIRVLTVDLDRVAEFTYAPLENLSHVQELINDPSMLNTQAFGFIPIELTALSGGLNIVLLTLAILAGVTQYIMSVQTLPKSDDKKRLRDILKEAAEGTQADQAEINAIVMRKMVKVLPVMMVFIMLNFPGGIVLYYVISNIIASVQQWWILREDVEEMEKIASQKSSTKTSKKSQVTAPAVNQNVSAKKREKGAKKANVTRIVAKDKGRRK